MAKHWYISAKYVNTDGETVVKDTKVSVPEGLGRVRVASGQWQKVGEYDDGGPTIAEKMTAKEAIPEKPLPQQARRVVSDRKGPAKA